MKSLIKQVMCFHDKSPFVLFCDIIYDQKSLERFMIVVLGY